MALGAPAAGGNIKVKKNQRWKQEYDIF